MSHFVLLKKSGFKSMLAGLFTAFLLLWGTDASAQYIYSATSDIVDAYTTPMTASVAHSAYIGKVGDGRVNAVRFNTFYKRWNSTEAWTKMQSNLRSLSLPGFAYDTTMLIGLDPRNAYQMHTQMEFIEHNSAGNISIVISTVNIVTEDIRYQFVPVQWKFVNEYPTKARFDSVTFNSTIFTPVPNPRSYRSRTNWSAPDVEYKMYVVYDYTENVRFGQEKQAESYVPMSADQPVTVALYDSLRISGLTMNQDYLLVPILEVRSSDGKGGRYQTAMSAFKTGIPTGVRLQDSSGKIVASSARDNATARVEYGLLKTTPEMRELYERAFSGEPLAKVSEVAHFLQDTGSYSYTFSKNNTSTFDFRDPKYPHHAGALMAYRVGVREAGADSSIYYAWDPQYPGIEKNSTYTLVSQMQQAQMEQVILNPAIQEPLHYGDTIILSATVIKGMDQKIPEVIFFWGKDSTKLAERWTERVVRFDKDVQDLPVALVTSTHISHLKYRPLTKYYYGAISDRNGGMPTTLSTITTASNAEVSGHNVEMADDGSLIPTFSANVKVNDLGGKLYFEYGKTTAYGSKTAVVDIPVADDFSTFRQFSAAGAKLDANAVYHFRAVMFDSAKNETYYTDDIEFISTFDASLGTRWFVQGMNSVFNTFSFPASTDPAITKVDFALRDSNNTNIEVKTISSIAKGNWQATFDMAKLQPKSTLHITGYNSSSTAILEMTAVRFGVLKNPGWLPEVADVYVDHDKKIIYYTPTAHIPFPSLERTFSSDLKFLANQTNSIANIFMPLEVEYNIATHKSKVSGPSIKFDARAATKDLPIGVSLFGKAVVDDDFGLDIELGGSVTGPTLPILAATGKFSFEDGLVEGELNCGISCTPVFDFDFLIGNPGFAYPSPGLVHIGSKSSYIDAGLDFFGGVKGSLSVAKGVGSVSSSLGLDLPVLIGVAFAELPENYASFIWGGDMSLKGNITVKVAGIKVFSMSKKFFSQKWGTIPSMHKRKDDGSSISTRRLS